MNPLDLMLALGAGLAVAAASGFRVFVPLLVMSLAAHTGHLELEGSTRWLGGDLALMMLMAATGIEIAGYYVPWVDNLLDTVATPAAVVAGGVGAAAMLGGMDPALQWAVGLLGGGAAAGTVQLLTVATRATSTATTGGLGNPIVSTAEAGAATGLAVLAIAVPLLAVAGAAGLAFLLARRWRQRSARRFAAQPQRIF
ncbi:MAG: DUF4126 domain-containing protein [Phycisphaeraceae bacterium]